MGRPCRHDYLLSIAQRALQERIAQAKKLMAKLPQQGWGADPVARAAALDNSTEPQRQALVYLELLRHRPAPDHWLPGRSAAEALRAELDRRDEACRGGQP